MALSRVTEIWDLPAIQANGEAVIGIINNTNKEIADSAKKVQSISFVGKNSITELRTYAKEAEGLTKDQVLMMQRLTKAIENLEKARVQEARASEVQTRESIRLTKEKERLAKQEEKNAQKARLASDAYGKLSKEYRDVARQAKNAYVQFGANSTQFKELSARALDFDRQLKAADASVGQFQRNVGNYNMVGMQFNQLLREAPNAGLSFRTFIMAISNNVSYFAESIQDARKQGASFRDIIGVMGKSMFGLVGAINIAVLAVTLITNKLTASKKATEEATSALEDYQNALKQAFATGRGEVSQASRDAEILNSIATDRKLNDEQRLRAVKELRRLYPSYLEDFSNEAILAGNAAAAIREIEAAITARAKAQGASNLAEENRKLLEDGENALILRRDQARIDLQDAERALDRAQRLATSQGGGDAISAAAAAVRVAKQEYTELSQQVELARNNQIAFTDEAKKFAKAAGDLFLPDNGDTEKNLKKQQKEYEKYLREQEKLLKEWRAMRTAEDEAQYKTQVMNLEQQSAAYMEVIQNENASDESRFEALTNYSQTRTLLITESYDREIAKGQKTATEVREIEQQKQLAISNLLIETDALDNKIIDDRVSRRRDALQAENEALAYWASIDLEIQANIERYEQEQHRRRMQRLQEWVNIATQASDMLVNINRRKTDKLLYQLDQEDEKNERNTEREVRRIERSQLSTVEKEEAIRQAEAASDEKRDEIERKRYEAERKRANFEKDLAVAKILINTFLAVAKEVGTKGVAGIATSGAITAFLGGVVGAAGAVAIPALAEGSDDATGLHLVGEGMKQGKYQPEVVVEQGRDPYIVDKPTLIDLKPHSQVIPMHKLTPDHMDMFTPMMMNKVMLLGGGGNKRTEQLLEELVALERKRSISRGSSNHKLTTSRGADKFMHDKFRS